MIFFLIAHNVDENSYHAPPVVQPAGKTTTKWVDGKAMALIKKALHLHVHSCNVFYLNKSLLLNGYD